jgi:hypothetical protein
MNGWDLALNRSIVHKNLLFSGFAGRQQPGTVFALCAYYGTSSSSYFSKGACMISKSLRVTILGWILLCVCSAANPIRAQQPDGDSLKETAPKVFVDCNYCDMDFIRTEITFVNHVRDRKDAHVHVLITEQTTGSGGTEYTLRFIGQEQFKGVDNELRYVSGKTDTAAEIRSGLVGILKLGLVSYAGKTPIASRLSVSFQEKTKPTSVQDKWNFWVFSISGRAYFNGEQLSRYYSLNGSFSANRITPGFKFRTSYSATRNTDRFTFGDTSIVSTSKNHNFFLLAVKSISNHWSVGGGLNAYSSTYSNVKFAIKPAPAIEYNFFPYSESTRRQLRVLWKPGYHSFKYREETIYDKTSERLWGQSFSVALELKEKWGTVTNSFEAFHYFNDLAKNHLQTWSELSLRLYKGLSLSLYGSFSRIRDQLSLPKGEASLEEVLLRRTQLATSYSYYGQIGLSYTFGSIFSNVVNPRFNGY